MPPYTMNIKIHQNIFNTQIVGTYLQIILSITSLASMLHYQAYSEVTKDPVIILIRKVENYLGIGNTMSFQPFKTN